MNNPIYIAYDNEDPILGGFFQSCADTVRQVAVDNHFDYELIGTSKLAKDVVNTYTSKSDEYLFCAFSHGNDTALLSNNEAYVAVGENVCNFYSSVFYTFACNTANGIGKEFEETYVLGYFGYNDEVWFVPEFEDDFMACTLKGVESYISGKTLEESRQDMIEEYDLRIREGVFNLAYAQLLKNKQALVSIINNGDKTIQD